MNNYRYKTQSRGAALLVFVIIFLVASAALVYGISRGVYHDVLQYRTLKDSKESFWAADAAIEDALYRHRGSKNYSDTEFFVLDNNSVTTTRALVLDTYEFTVVSRSGNIYRKEFMELLIGGGASFNFGLQSGNGGIFMENTSSVRGNVFSNGTVEGANSNLVYGDIISAGPTGHVLNAHATGSVWANTIEDSRVDIDAYYQTIISPDVGGVLYPGSADQATASMPISDALIDEWKAEAEAGGVILSTDPECVSPPYVIDSDITIGPVKIECDVIIDKNSTDVYLQGTIWIVGSLDTKSSPDIHVDASLDGKTVPIITDNPADRDSSSKITLQNSATFSGYGSNSYIILVSQNDSAENGGGETAINLKNSASGDILFYAAHGKLLIENSGSLKEATAYQIHLKNSAEVIYESGLANLLFTSGPGGGYIINKWTEI